MDINAPLFSISSISSSLGPACTALCSWSQGLVLGYKDGSLLIVKAPDDAGSEEWQVIRIAKQLSRVPLRCLQVGYVDDAERLFALTHEGITLYSVLDLQLKAQAYKSAGATSFAWRGMPAADTQDPSRSQNRKQLLVYGKNRRLYLCAYSSRDLIFVSDMVMPEAPVAVAWCGNQVCAVTRSTLFLADPAAKTTQPLYTWKKDAVTALIQLSPTQCLFQHDEELWYIDANSGRAQAPWTLPRVPRTLTYAHPFVISAYDDAIEVYAAAEASMHPSLQRVAMSQLDMGETEEEKQAEAAPVQPLLRMALHQLGKDKHEPGGVLLAAWATHSVAVVKRTSGHACLLRAKALSEQVSAIAQGGLAQEALLLCQHEDFSECHALKDDLHICYGVSMFAQGEYEQGMLQVGSSSRIEPLAILQFFPALLPPSMQEMLDLDPTFRAPRGAKGPSPSSPTYRSIIELLLPYLFSYRSRLLSQSADNSQVALSLQATPGGSPTKSRASRSKRSYSPRSALDAPSSTLDSRSQFEARSQYTASAGPSQPTSPGRDAMSERDAVADKAAIGEEKPAASVRVDLNPGAASGNAAAGQVCSEESDALDLEQLGKMQAIVDIALLNAWLVVGDRIALMRLIKGDNHVPLVEGRWALSQAGLYLELVELYRQHEQHTEALELLYRLSREPDELSPAPDSAAASLKGVPGVWAAFKYIHGMPTSTGEYSLLICSHAERWLLAADGEACVEAILQLKHAVPPTDALLAIESAAPHLAQSYLEAALDAGIATPQQFHPKLAQMYLADLKGKDPSPPIERSPLKDRQISSTAPVRHTGKDETPKQAAAARKLLALLLSSKHLNVLELQRGIPSSGGGRGLLHVRAIIHEQLGQHDEALAIYVNDLQDPTLAEEFADRLYTILKEQQAPTACAHVRPDHGTLRNSGLLRVISIPSVKQPEDIYTWLLKEFVAHAKHQHALQAGQQPATGDRNPWANPLMLLGRKWKSMDVAEALAMLPDELPVGELAPCLSSILKGMLKRSHEQMLHVGLLKSSMFDLKRQEVLLRQRNVVVSSVSVCAGCQRRIGNTQCLATPSYKMWHEGCYNMRNRSRAQNDALG